MAVNTESCSFYKIHVLFVLHRETENFEAGQGVFVLQDSRADEIITVELKYEAEVNVKSVSELSKGLS